MIRRIASYRIKKDAQENVLTAIEEFVEAIEENEPGTIYSVYRHEDGRTFTHFMSFPGEQAEESHKSAPYTKKFVDILYPTCEEPPIFEAVELVKSSHIRFN